jgi:hypothetical protein
MDSSGPNASEKAHLEMARELTAEDCALRISAVPRRKFAWTKCADKWIAARIGADRRTAQNYLYGKHSPPAHKLVELMAECSELADEINRLVAERRAARGEK